MYILVVDDHPIVVCDALAKYLEEIGPGVCPQTIKVKCVHTLEKAIADACSPEPPDLVFLDLNLDLHNNSTTTLKNFQEHNKTNIPVVVFTGMALSESGTVDVLKFCLNELGARTVITKGASLSTMFIGLPRILAGEKWMSDEILTALLQAPASNANMHLDLTPRQWDVARGLTHGLRNKEIANNLGLAEGNVRQIVSAIYRKLGVHSRIAVSNLIRDAQQKTASQGHSDLV
jgi:DNA-binding NarL/FixJ family response regulator